MVTSIEGIKSDILDFKLDQNYPNPFNPHTKIRFSVGSSCYTTLKLFDDRGTEIGVLFSDLTEAGRKYIIDVDGSNLANGVYFYKVQTGKISATKKLILMK
jgi:hypothetical protein